MKPVFNLFFAFMASATILHSQQNDTLNPYVPTKKTNTEGFRDVARASSRALIEIDATSPLGPVNRRLFGICMVRPPFTDQMGTLLSSWLEGGTMRIWPSPPPGMEPTSTDEYWQQSMMVAEKSKPAAIMGWVPGGWGSLKKGETYYYRSEQDTNLPNSYHPAQVEAFVRDKVALPHPGYPHGYPVDYWEIWNEPEYNPLPGGFVPEEYARYVVDCSRRIKSIKPGLKVGAFVPHRRGGENENWADRFLKELYQLNPQAVDFFENHGYNGTAWDATEDFGTYLPRVSFAEELQDRAVENVTKRLEKFGFGKYPVWNTEWNIHPPIPKDWKKMNQDAKLSTVDLGAAIYAAAMLTVWQNKETLDAAAFFDLNSTAEGAPCFSLFRQPKKEDSLEIHPTFYAMQLVGEALHGTRYAAKVSCDSYRLPVPKPWEVSWSREYAYVLATAAVDQESLRLIVVNREPHYPLKLDLKITGLSSWNSKREKSVVVKTLTGDTPEALAAKVTEKEVILNPSKLDENASQIDLPPHSVNVIIWNGWK